MKAKVCWRRSSRLLGSWHEASVLASFVALPLFRKLIHALADFGETGTTFGRRKPYRQSLRQRYILASPDFRQRLSRLACGYITFPPCWAIPPLPASFVYSEAHDDEKSIVATTAQCNTRLIYRGVEMIGGNVVYRPSTKRKQNFKTQSCRLQSTPLKHVRVCVKCSSDETGTVAWTAQVQDTILLLHATYTLHERCSIPAYTLNLRFKEQASPNF